MRLSALLAVLPLALAAPATDSKRSIPELDVSQWNDIQSNFIDRVWNGLTGWSWNKAEEMIGVAKDEGKTIYQQLKEDEQFSKVVKAIEVGSGFRSNLHRPRLTVVLSREGQVRRPQVALHLLCERSSQLTRARLTSGTE